LARPCLRHDPRRDVDGDAADVVAHEFALSGVNAGADLDPQRFRVSAQRLGAADRVRGSVERGAMAVAGALDDGSAEAFGEALGDFTEPLQERAPAVVAHRGRPRGGRYDVGEQHRPERTVRLTWRLVLAGDEPFDG